jgi:hypothetical protein
MGVCVCIHTYTYIHIHIHVHIYTHIHIFSPGYKLVAYNTMDTGPDHWDKREWQFRGRAAGSFPVLHFSYG